MDKGSAAIRESFLRYFQERDHLRVPSAGLVPVDDPTLLFTNAGMNQFKDAFTGRTRFQADRATSVQKCVRAGGKHNDLENVGRTPRHHTFFEMLGNFSFGDYFKREAIGYAWELLTEVFGLQPQRLWVTVYRDDDEAARLWREISGLPADRIVPLGEKDNFWAMGETGPCGPCSEVLYDRGEAQRCAASECGIGRCDCARWLEIWNLVFMQFDRDGDGKLSPLPRPSIDTGMGLERIASVLQGVDSNYDTDLFQPILQAIGALSGLPYVRGEAGFPFRVIADHARACTFLVADGARPSNEHRGYVLRRILRRAARFGRRIGLDEPFLWKLVPAVRQAMAGAYPELAQGLDAIEATIRQEEERFGETLADGLGLLERAIAETRAGGGRHLSGETAFRLHDTYGFPLDLTLDVAEEHGLVVDVPRFEQALAEQRRRARADRRARGVAVTEGVDLEDVPETTFVGYEALSAEAEVLAILADGRRRLQAEPGDEVVVLLDRSPFYAEGGGQVGDQGTLQAAATDGGARLVVTAARRLGRTGIAHVCRVEQGTLRPAAVVQAVVDGAYRRDVARNHSATHLLQRALREVLGHTVHQAGSLVAPERLRFDFTYDRPVTVQQQERVAEWVNARILDPVPVDWFVSGLEDARRMGAMALFGEKYGQRVRVVRMGPWSLELCGGTHVDNTAQIGLFHILAETGIGSGVRRIEAVTGPGVLRLLAQRQEQLARAATALRALPDEVPSRVEELVGRLAQRERELAAQRREDALRLGTELAAQAEDLGGAAEVRLVQGRVAAAEVEALRRVADAVRDRLGSGAVLLAATAAERPVLLCALTPDLVRRGLHAGRAVAAAALAAGGRGGGRPDLAHAGIPGADGIDAALAAGADALRTQAANQRPSLD